MITRKCSKGWLSFHLYSFPNRKRKEKKKSFKFRHKLMCWKCSFNLTSNFVYILLLVVNSWYQATISSQRLPLVNFRGARQKRYDLSLCCEVGNVWRGNPNYLFAQHCYTTGRSALLYNRLLTNWFGYITDLSLSNLSLREQC